jgi:Zn-dependent protease/predicted transcriptional regulator
MRWSWKIGSFRGIKVYMHATFLLLVGFVVLSHRSAGASAQQTLEGVGFILALFACVVLHEFGHALMAARYGIRTRDITLLPIGGLARLEHMPDDPRQELWVALAGPAVNVVIAGLLFVAIRLTGVAAPLDQLTVTGGPILERLLVVNIVLAAFNMLPAFPMDGGRVLRAMLATRMEYTRATQIAAHIGQAMALVFGFVGLFHNPLLVFIALFVWIGATQEASMVQLKSSLAGIPVARAMTTHFERLAPRDPLSHAVEQTIAGSQQDFPVMEGGRVVGILTRQDLLAGLAQHGKDAPVEGSMQHEVRSVEASQMLEGALGCLREGACHAVTVMRNGELVGLVTMDGVGEFVAIQAATKDFAGRASGPKTGIVAALNRSQGPSF